MKLDVDILTVLSDLTIEDKLVRIETKLDRKLYVRVNTVLEAIGGVWNRKAKAHVFRSDPRPRLDLVLTTGEVETGQDVGFFETPELLARRLVKLADVRRQMNALEPSAGRGRIVEAIQDVGAIVTALEWDGERRDHLLAGVLKSRDKLVGYHDFLDYTPTERFDRVVMNPPFCKVGKGDHIDHVHHAYRMLVPGGVLVSVLPSSVQFRRDSRYREFRDWLLGSGTIESLPEGSFKASGTDVNTCVARITR